jgi:hypothetical protein
MNVVAKENSSPRRMLKVHHAFERHRGLELDGLVDEAYVGAVYGNSPSDGNLTNCDTINTALDKAAVALRGVGGLSLEGEWFVLIRLLKA